MTNENDLVESAQRHRASQHADIFLTVLRIQCSDRLIPEKRLVLDALTLAHVINGNPKIHGLIHQHELPSRKLIYQAGPVQCLVPNLNVEVVCEAPAIRLWPLCAKPDLELVVEAAFQ